jgi:maltokinase
VIAHDQLAEVLAAHLPGQRWYAGASDEAVRLEVVAVDVLQGPWPALVQALVRPESSGATYQVVLGLLAAGSAEAVQDHRPEAVVGEIDTEAGPAIAYDATVDPELALALLRHIAPDQEVERARALSAEQSNSSVIYDERLFLKLFRRLPEGPNPDAEVTRALSRLGFDHVAHPVAEWRGPDTDFAVVTEFLVGAVDGFQLALTSLRDLYDRRIDPAEAGGDFAPEASRLGDVTGRLHVAMAEAFGAGAGDGAAWVADMEAQLDRGPGGDLPVEQVRAAYRRLLELPSVGPAIRVHGDYHLGQVVRTDTGWFVLDFEGEPARPIDERRRPSSPLKDVAGMLRSLHYAAEVAKREWADVIDDEIDALGRAWEERNGLAFLHGYLSAPGVDAVLPEGDEARDAVLDAFLLDKAVYEVAYEAAHRPDWVQIPLSAVRRLLEATP